MSISTAAALSGSNRNHSPPAGVRAWFAARQHHTVEQLGHGSVRHRDRHPHGKGIHVIANSLSVHKTQQLGAALAVRGNVPILFSSICTSWLSLKASWFAKTERDVDFLGVFPPLPDPKRKLMR